MESDATFLAIGIPSSADGSIDLTTFEVATEAIGEEYDVGTGSSVTINELTETIVAVTDSDSEITHTEDRDGDIHHSEAHITAAQTALSYEPTVSLNDGLEQTVEWLREQ